MRSRIPDPARMAMVTDASNWFTHHGNKGGYNGRSMPATGENMGNCDRHHGDITVVSFDGHASSVSASDATTDMVLWGDQLEP